jgi:ribonuclease HI
MRRKFYVVWAGRQTGVFPDWPTALRAVEKFPGARFKSFESRVEAEQAFARGHASVSGETPNRASLDKTRRDTAKRNDFDVTIYCDGACEPNPGNAGSGIVVYRSGKLTELWYGLYHPNGTNNTAELNALCHALRMAEAEIQNSNTVEVCSDSAYSINSIRTWAPNWEKKGWTRSGGEIKNLQIIQDCYAIFRRIQKNLTLTHVAGHAGTEGNELADRMAMLAVQRKEKPLSRYEETMDVPTLLKMRAG